MEFPKQLLCFFETAEKPKIVSHHDNHEEVGIIASEIAEEKSLELIQFCYVPVYGGGTATVANKRADYYFPLNYEELKFKLALIDCFPNEMGNLKNLSYPCPNPEAFEGNSLPTPPFIKGCMRGFGFAR